jgi:hypothetical protein
VAFVLDLSERKRAEEALRELESDLPPRWPTKILHPGIVTAGHIETSKVALTLAHFFAGGVKRIASAGKALFSDRPAA